MGRVSFYLLKHCVYFTHLCGGKVKVCLVLNHKPICSSRDLLKTSPKTVIVVNLTSGVNAILQTSGNDAQ